jgi:hypothetical protein
MEPPSPNFATKSANKKHQQQVNKARLPAGELGRYLALFHLLECGLKVFGESSRLPVQRSLNQIVLSTLLKPRFVAQSFEHGLRSSHFDG